ncbi:unnamed protein product [Rotaria sordida]|uniref:Uncharacterized protein n=1 Tax=Rotaria sordida TaxID=392033 RepID=A0A818V887_9BILA|nr:unnamed protein product [Rotaria sordida]
MYGRKTRLLLELHTATSIDAEKLIRNHVLHSLYCVKKNESYQWYFFLEVNEQPWHIHPIASEESSELRYLHSTPNLFNYISNYDNNTFLYVKLLRGRPPIKTIDYHVISLVNPDLPVKVKLLLGKYKCHSLFDIHKAELQCMQLSRALLSRDESEVYVTIEDDKTIVNYLKSNDNQLQQKSSNTNEKHINEIEIIRNNQISNPKTENKVHFKQLVSIKNFSNNDKIISNQQKIILGHSTSNKLYQNHDKRLKQNEKSHQIQQTIIQNRPILLSSSSSLSTSTFNNHRNIN